MDNLHLEYDNSLRRKRMIPVRGLVSVAVAVEIPSPLLLWTFDALLGCSRIQLLTYRSFNRLGDVINF